MRHEALRISFRLGSSLNVHFVNYRCPLRRIADTADSIDWLRQHRRIINELRRFRAVFPERVRALRLDSFGEPDGAEDEAGV
jgi:hypothetical protein